MKVTAQYAAAHFDDLAKAVDSGEIVEIARVEKPALRLVLSHSETEHAPQAKRVLGAGTGLLRVPDDEEWERMDREWRKSFAEKFDLDDGA